jgi:hypothetical protein
VERDQSVLRGAALVFLAGFALHNGDHPRRGTSVIGFASPRLG